MIIFLHHGARCFRTHRKITGHRDLVSVKRRTYDWLLKVRKLPQATYIFTGRETMDPWELRIYAAFYRHLNAAGAGYRAINDPAMMLDRPALLRRLHTAGVNHFNAYRPSEHVTPASFPVFIRRAFDHAKPLTGLLKTEQQLESELTAISAAGESHDGLLIIEYCAEPVAGDMFRKLSTFRAGGRCFFYHTVHEQSWLVKYGTENIAGDALYQDERRMLESNAYEAELSHVFALAGIEYGRADFGLVDGKVQVYEINTNPTVRPPQAHPNAIRTGNIELGWEFYCAELNALDTTDRRAPRAKLFEHPFLQRKLRRILRDGSRIKR